MSLPSGRRQAEGSDEPAAGTDPHGRRSMVAYDDLDGRPSRSHGRQDRHYEDTIREAAYWYGHDQYEGRMYAREAEYDGWHSHWREDRDQGRRGSARSEHGYYDHSRDQGASHERQHDREWHDEGHHDGYGARQGRYHDERRWEGQGQGDEREEQWYGPRRDWHREGAQHDHDEHRWEGDGRFDVPSTSSRWAGRTYRGRSEDYHEGDDANGGGRERDASDRLEMPPPATQLRLVKLSSDVIPQDQHIAVIDARSDPVSIGRDRSFTARLRLPAMEVSKHHANLFWMPVSDRSLGKFQITDTGSTHGTFLLPHAQISKDLAGEGCATDESAEQGLAGLKTSLFQRLAESKKASAPRDLGHGDLLRLGKTTLQVHLHPGGLACALCGLGGEIARGEIPLLPNQQGGLKGQTPAQGMTNGASAAGVSQDDAAAPTSADNDLAAASTPTSQAFTYGGDRKVESEMLRRSRMKELRATYLGADEAEESEKRERVRENWKKKKNEKERSTKSGEAIKVLGAEETKSKGGYVDRAAQRRALQGSLPPTSGEEGKRAKIVIPGPQQPRPDAPSSGPRSDVPEVKDGGPSGTGAGWKPAAALDGRNKGFQLYAMMGAPSSGVASTNASAYPNSEALSEDAAGQGVASATHAPTNNPHQAPIEARGVTGRAGLGAAKLLSVEELGRGHGAAGGAGGQQQAWAGEGRSREEQAKGTAKGRDYVEKGRENARKRLASEMGQEG